jgi:hypothetical protein
MISDALAETVIEEAEAIVRAELVRLHHDTAPRDSACREACCEMPAARTCSVVTATSTAELGRPRGSLPGLLPGLPRTGGPQRRVWPTQRSPPRYRNSIERGEVMP